MGSAYVKISETAINCCQSIKTHIRENVCLATGLVYNIHRRNRFPNGEKQKPQLKPRFHIRVVCESEHMSVIPHVRLRFVDATKWIAPCTNWSECESNDWIENFTTPNRKIVDSTFRFEYPVRVSHENRSEDERGVRNSWIPQYRIRYRNAAYTFRFACRIYGISALLHKFINTNIASTGHNSYNSERQIFPY